MAHLVDYLLEANFRLFIDHPERIPGFTRDVCRERGIETLWSTDENRWPDRLSEAIDECDCLLAVLSDALTESALDAENLERRQTNRRIEWNNEIISGATLKKVAFAKIGSYKAELLPAYIRGVDAIDVTLGSDPERLESSLEILVQDRIPAAIARGRRYLLGDEGDGLRTIADMLPLCVGRRYQRRAVMQSFALLKESRRIHPVVIAGPENELPERFLEALSYQDDGEASRQSFLLKRVEWPSGAAASFVDDYASNLAETFCDDFTADLRAVAAAIAREGHPTVIHSRFDLLERRIEQSMLGEWLDFWAANGELFAAVQVVPAVSLLLGEARPGWSDCPPPETDNPEDYRRNFNALRWLANLAGEGSEVERYVRSRLTAPIARSQAQLWADNINETLLKGRREGLKSKIDALYPDEDAREFGVNHKRFHKEMAQWLKGE